MMRIALIKPPPTYSNWYKRPVLGISYIAACIERKDFIVRIFDSYFNDWNTIQLLEKIIEFKPDIVGFVSMTHEIMMAVNTAYQIKEKLQVPIIIGGPHITALPEQTFNEFPVFDYGVVGEGEETLLELVQRLVSGKNDLSDIKGLVYRIDNRIVVNKPRPYLTTIKLNRLPLPAFHNYYKRGCNALSGKNNKYVMISSRGCPYRCSFCMQVLGHKIRYRSIDSICDEIEYAIREYGAHTIDFVDEIFLFNNDRTHKLLLTFIKKDFPLKIRWSGLTRANMVNKEIIKLAKEAGCMKLDMGVESGDDKMLQRIRKSTTIKQIKEATKIIKNEGIPLMTYYIIGHPGETYETAMKTIRLACNLNTDEIAVGLMVPYPGTEIYQMAKENKYGYKLLSENWTEYDKFGGRVISNKELSYKTMVTLQKKAYLFYYLKNCRFYDLLKDIWKKKSAIIHFATRKCKMHYNPYSGK